MNEASRFDISRVVNLFEVEFWERTYRLCDPIDVEVVYYIVEGLVRVLSNNIVPYMIRSVIKLQHFIQCQIRFWECERHGESNMEN